MTADCFLNGIILSLYHVRTVCEDFNSQAVFVFESKMMGRSSAYAVERWLLYRQHQGFTVSNGEGPDAAFCLGGGNLIRCAKVLIPRISSALLILKTQ